MDTKQINKAIEILKKDLGSSLINCDIWVSGSGQPIASYNGGNAKAAALFDQITNNINNAIDIAKFPKLNPYYLFNTEDGKSVLVLLVNNLQWGIVVDTQKTPLGLLLNIAVPNAMEALKKAF